MNEISSSENHLSRLQFTATPLSLLAWLELRVIKRQYSTLIKQSAALDAWYVSDGEEIVGPEKLGDILNRLMQGQSGFAILHQSDEGKENPAWHQLNYRAWSLDPLLSTVWIILFWSLSLLAGWVGISLLLPLRFRIFCEIAYLFALLAFAGGAFSQGVRASRFGHRR